MESCRQTILGRFRGPAEVMLLSAVDLAQAGHYYARDDYYSRDQSPSAWAGAGLLEAEKKFRKVKGYRELQELAGKLNPPAGRADSQLTPQQQVA